MLLDIKDAVKVVLNYLGDIDNYPDEEGIEYIYQEMEQKCWLTGNTDPALKRLNDLIMDMNPAEICSQIERDNLKNWCELIQVEMQMALIKAKGLYND